MTAEDNRCFLKERICEIKSALLYNLSDDIIKTPVSIITVLKMDSDGWLWFYLPKPSHCLSDNEKTFPARLQFYRKGKPFYLLVTGVAHIEENKIEVGFIESLRINNREGSILIKLRMTKAEYYEPRPHPLNHNPIVSVFQNIYSALFKPAVNHRPVELNTAA